MLELFMSFMIGVIFSAFLVLCYYKAFDIHYLLTTIKEDVNNMQVTLQLLFDKTK